MDDTILELLKRSIKTRMGDVQMHLVMGGPKDFAEYSSTAAKYRILNDIYEEIEELEKRFLEE